MKLQSPKKPIVLLNGRIQIAVRNVRKDIMKTIDKYGDAFAKVRHVGCESHADLC